MRERGWGGVRRSLREFAGLDPAATLLWPRWLVLRAVGLMYLVIFAGVIAESPAILGTNGIAPLPDFFAQLGQEHLGTVAFFKAPTLFWLASSDGAMAALAWAGLVAALALTFNLWPRLSLFACWALFLSFVVTWGEFSPAQLDGLMLETALLCIPFTPAGLRPGLGAHAPPRPIAVFMLRWLLFRVMFEPGLAKLISVDPSWRNLTAMDFMHATSPLPTVLGWWAHQLPHAWHVGEIAFTFAAELAAPLLAVLAGRRGRWTAFALWSVFQVGIALTASFGWLNLAALALGLLLLDDAMIASVVARVGRSPFPTEGGAPIAPWRLHGLRVLLGCHFALTLYYFALAARLPEDVMPAMLSTPAQLLANFHSANRYTLYARVHPVHVQVEFEGSIDGGRTWRNYEYRHLPQRLDRPPGFVAPWFPRLENAILFESERATPAPQPTSVIVDVATQLLRRNPEVIARFARDPFADGAPPTVIRMRRYRYAFTDRVTRRRTGDYWRREDAGDFSPALHRTEGGTIERFDLGAADAARAAGNGATALAGYERQYRLGNLEAGFRLADMYVRGPGAPPQPEKMFALMLELAERGEPAALHTVALCYEHGAGVRADAAKAAEYYRRAAERGWLLSMLAYGSLAARDRLDRTHDVEALAWLFVAGQRATGDDAVAQLVRRDQPAAVQRLRTRMSAAEIADAEARAKVRR